MSLSIYRRTVGVAVVAAISWCAVSVVAAAPPEPAPAKPPAAVEDARDAVRDAREKARDERLKRKESIRDAGREARDKRRAARRLTREQLGIDFGKLTERGLAIANVATDGLLAKAGFRMNDIVASVNGQPVKSESDFHRQLNAADPTKDVEVTILRDGKEEVLPLPSQALYGDAAAGDLNDFGVTVSAQHPNQVVLKTVRPDSPASLAGLRAGDEIITWQGKRVATKEFPRVLRETKPGTVDFEYRRDAKTLRGQAQFAPHEALPPPANP